MNADFSHTFENQIPPDTTLVVYEIDKATIADGNTESVCHFWSLPRIAANGRLRDLFGCVVFHISGYDDDEREFVEIPQVRAYLQKLSKVWPYFFYAADLDDSFLIELMKCMATQCIVGVNDSSPDQVTVAISPEELNRCYGLLYDGLIAACKMDRGMNHDFFNARVDAVQAYIHSHFPQG